MIHQKDFIFVTIKGSTITKFIIFDCLTGTGIYYAVKFITASIIIGLIGSVVGTEEIKKRF